MIVIDVSGFMLRRTKPFIALLQDRINVRTETTLVSFRGGGAGLQIHKKSGEGFTIWEQKVKQSSHVAFPSMQ